MSAVHYIGRFAPSPTGPLHEGSLVTALASWLDAKAHQGQWLIRIEDVDQPRCIAGADEFILRQLSACGLIADADVTYQSKRFSYYEKALQQMQRLQWVYKCTCSRADIARARQQNEQERVSHHHWVYPGTCRLVPKNITAEGAWRAALPETLKHPWQWHDRRLGKQQQCLPESVGDFVVRRADGLWAYQLAVVVDDAAQGITHVVRGEDLADNTARQQWLQQVLSLPTPYYLHTPLVCNAQGQKLSKQTLAPAVKITQPLSVLKNAAKHLGLPNMEAATVSDWLNQAVLAWPYVRQ